MKKVLILNDISGLGNCSLAANLPIFSKLGHYCMPIVTAAFSCQTGFEKYTFSRNEKLTQSVTDLIANAMPDAAYVGFGLDSRLLAEISECLHQIEIPFLFVDPVMGDNGQLYNIFDKEYVYAMKALVVGADCISPNLTEACLLADLDYGALEAQMSNPTFLAICGDVFKNFLSKTGARSAVITGVPCGNVIGNVVLDGTSVRYVTNERIPTNFSGTGDVFSSVLLGQLLNGCTLLHATEIAANFVAKAAEKTQRSDRRFGIDFCRVVDLL